MVTMVMTMVILERLTVRHIKASEFKAKCLKIMDEVQATGEEIVVTKNGKPVAKMSAMRETPKTLWYFGMGKGEFEIVGDIVNSPFEEWSVDPEPTVLVSPSKAARQRRSVK